MMTKFVADGFRAVEAESAEEAARIFANRLAHREYGRGGYCRTVRLDCRTQDWTSYTFEAFIGRDVARNSCQGRDVWVYVNKAA